MRRVVRRHAPDAMNDTRRVAVVEHTTVCDAVPYKGSTCVYFTMDRTVGHYFDV